jgi:hypothetical protein
MIKFISKSRGFAFGKHIKDTVMIKVSFGLLQSVSTQHGSYQRPRLFILVIRLLSRISRNFLARVSRGHSKGEMRVQRTPLVPLVSVATWNKQHLRRHEQLLQICYTSNRCVQECKLQGAWAHYVCAPSQLAYTDAQYCVCSVQKRGCRVCCANIINLSKA